MSAEDLGQILFSTTPRDAGFDGDGLCCVDGVMRSGLGTVFPAAVLLVARRGGVALHRAYGYLDPDDQLRPTQTHHLFDLASLTKLFTVTGFMTLVEEGRVALETPVADVLTEFGGVRLVGPAQDPLTKMPQPADPLFVGQSVAAGLVTWLHLLTHTSGLAAWHSLYREDGEQGDKVPMPHLVPAARRARRVSAIHEKLGFAFPPGQRLVYSDLGIILLGEAMARLADSSLESVVRTRVLQPLGQEHTQYNPLVHGTPPQRIVPTEFCAWRQRRCVGEVHDENAASLGGVSGHAGLFSTAWDVAALGQTYLNGGSYGASRVLTPETVSEMTRTQMDFDDNPRGLGWLKRSQAWSSSGRHFGPHSYGHTGFTGASLWVDPERQLVVALLTNRVFYGRDPEGIMGFRPRLHDAVAQAMRV